MTDSIDRRGDIEKLHEASFAWSLVCCRGDREEASDVLQTTYLKILDGRARFRGEGSFQGWLFAVIRNTAAGRRRRTALRYHLLERWWLAEPEADEPGPERQALSTEDESTVRDALRGLSPRQREVLELVFYHDLSLREAARIMGCRLGTVRVHYDRGKKLLLQELRDRRSS